MDGTEWITPTAYLIALGIAIIIFLILREFWCWYWKINEIRNNQRETLVCLKDFTQTFLDWQEMLLKSQHDLVDAVTRLSQKMVAPPAPAAARPPSDPEAAPKLDQDGTETSEDPSLEL